MCRDVSAVPCHNVERTFLRYCGVAALEAFTLTTFALYRYSTTAPVRFLGESGQSSALGILQHAVIFAVVSQNQNHGDFSTSPRFRKSPDDFLVGMCLHPLIHLCVISLGLPSFPGRVLASSFEAFHDCKCGEFGITWSARIDPAHMVETLAEVGWSKTFTRFMNPFTAERSSVSSAVR